MKQPVYFNVGFLLACMMSLHLYDITHDNHLTVERAMEPMHHLSDARYFIINNDYNKSYQALEDAITAMKIVEHHADSIAAEHIDQAIADLRLVEDEIAHDSVVVADLNRAFFNALNSIAYANVKIAEESLDRGEKYAAMSYMNTSFTEMITSLKFATTDDQKEMENQVIDDIRGILKKLKATDYQYRFNYDSLNKEIEELIEPH